MANFDKCPFCGGHPTFKYNGWQDESRYVSADLECCVTMTESVGWRRARDMKEHDLKTELMDRLTKQWNTRHEEEEENG